MNNVGRLLVGMIIASLSSLTWAGEDKPWDKTEVRGNLQRLVRTTETGTVVQYVAILKNQHNQNYCVHVFQKNTNGTKTYEGGTYFESGPNAHRYPNIPPETIFQQYDQQWNNTPPDSRCAVS